MNTNILQDLLKIQSPSGNEKQMRDFLINFFRNNSTSFKNQPELWYGKGFQNCLIAVFGKPELAIYVHMDTTGYMVRYGRELVEVGMPASSESYHLVGYDAQGPVECSLQAVEGDKLFYDAPRLIERGTELVFKPNYYEDQEFIQSPYLDNRLGIWNVLELAPQLDHAALVFSTWEEQHGGSTAYLGKILFERLGIVQALISDVTWTSEGIKSGGGAVISLRDSGIPRREYVTSVIQLAKTSGIPFQIEVECSGASDGNELQRSPYPIDWCFIGIPVEEMHSPKEKALKIDIQAANDLYKYLLDNWEFVEE